MNKETKPRTESRNASLAKHVFILLCCLALGIALYSDGDIFKSPQGSGVSLEDRYQAILEGDGKRIWNEQLVQLERQAAQYIRQEMRGYRRAVLSPARIDSFCDEYYGYFKGFKFMFLGAFDFFSDKRRIEREIRDMIQEHLLYDTEAFAISLRNGIAEHVRENVQEYSAMMEQLMQKRFTSSEREVLSKSVGVAGIKVGSSQIHTLGVFGGTSLVLNSQLVQGAIQKITNLITSKLITISSTMVTNVLTFGLGFLLDYLFSRGVRYLQEASLKRSLETSMRRFLDSMENQLLVDISKQIRSLAVPR